MSGRLYVVSTPIGNLKDITLRALEVLKSVSFIAAEDTRVTRGLLAYFGISKPLVSFFEGNRAKRSEEILRRLQNGEDAALVSSAGTPLLSDPGYFLVQRALAEGLSVSPIPGASSALSALVASGLPCDDFIFLGFLPKRKGKAKRVLREAAALGKTLVLFESGRRILKTLKMVQESLGESSICVAREMTKIYEEFLRGEVQTVMADLEKNPRRGEMTLCVFPGKVVG